MFDIFHERYSF